MKEHRYKGFIIERSGTRAMPWNVYKMKYSTFLKREVPTHVGFGETLVQCKHIIDEGLCTEEVR